MLVLSNSEILFNHWLVFTFLQFIKKKNDLCFSHKGKIMDWGFSSCLPRKNKALSLTPEPKKPKKQRQNQADTGGLVLLPKNLQSDFII